MFLSLPGLRWLLQISFLTITIVLKMTFVQGQTLENFGKEDPIKLSGSLNATAIGYSMNGMENRRDPFNWFLTGNMNVDIYGWSVPFSFSYSNQEKAFRQPFNQYGIAPQYKWIKTYIGYHNLTYSSYTLAGHVFLGGAVELNPGKFRFHAMYGRLNKAIDGDSAANIPPAYKRMGFAMKAGYGDNQNSIDFVLFRAQDDKNSIYNITDTTVLPMENLAISLIGKKKILKRFFLTAEVASSALTRDTQSEKMVADNKNVFSYASALYTSRRTSEYNNAFKTSLLYAADWYSVQLNYERIDPGYRTLGAYYFNNDLENITVSGGVKLLENKLDIAANIGTQRNNLADTEVSSMRRTIGSINFAYLPTERWNINGSYSNLTSYTNVRPKYDPFFQNDLDTLNFYQISQNAAASVAYTIGNREVKRSILLNANFQLANEESDRDSTATNTSRLYSGNLMYRHAIVANNLSISLGINGNKNELGGQETISAGPNLIITKAFFQKKLRSMLSTTYNQVTTDGELTSKVLNVRVNGSVAVKEKHTFSLNLAMQNKLAVSEEQTGFTEYTATLNYGYSF